MDLLPALKTPDERLIREADNWRIVSELHRKQRDDAEKARELAERKLKLIHDAVQMVLDSDEEEYEVVFELLQEALDVTAEEEDE